MIFLIDTNVLSEVRKQARCHPRVAAWYQSVAAADLYLSVLVLGEIRRGIERLRPRDARQASGLQAWLDTVNSGFGNRILPIDRAVADEWGRLSAVRTVPIADAMLAATAIVHGMILATRNESDMAGLGVPVMNPFKFGD